MIDLDREILETALRQPGLTIGGLADQVAPGGETQSRIRDLIDRGILANNAGVKLTEKGRNRILAGLFAKPDPLVSHPRPASGAFLRSTRPLATWPGFGEVVDSNSPPMSEGHRKLWGGAGGRGARRVRRTTDRCRAWHRSRMTAMSYAACAQLPALESVEKHGGVGNAGGADADDAAESR